MKYLLDTNVFRELGKALPHANVSAWLKTVDDADLGISGLTVREVTKGIVRLRASKPDVAAAIEARVATIFVAFSGRILAVDSAIAAIWGEMLADVGRRVPLLNPYKDPPEAIAVSPTMLGSRDL